jgi:hypothetical protein
VTGTRPGCRETSSRTSSCGVDFDHVEVAGCGLAELQRPLIDQLLFADLLGGRLPLGPLALLWVLPDLVEVPLEELGDPLCLLTARLVPAVYPGRDLRALVADEVCELLDALVADDKNQLQDRNFFQGHGCVHRSRS